MPNYWTDDRVAELTRRYRAGETASAIALALGGGVTRSAVLGKIHRLGMSEPKVGRSPTPKQIALRSPAKPRTIALVEDGPIVVQRQPDHDGRGSRECIWPIGDTRSTAFRFCCEPAVAGRHYCAVHCRKAGISAAPKAMLVMGRVARPYRLRQGER